MSLGIAPLGTLPLGTLSAAGGGGAALPVAASLDQAAQTIVAQGQISIVADASPVQAGDSLAATAASPLAAAATLQQASQAVVAVGAVDILANSGFAQAAQSLLADVAIAIVVDAALVHPGDILAALIGEITVSGPPGPGAPMRRPKSVRPANIQAGSRPMQASASRPRNLH